MPTLDWIGKKAVVNHHREVPYRLIHCDSALSAGDAEAGNLLVQGDNLETLRALLPYQLDVFTIQSSDQAVTTLQAQGFDTQSILAYLDNLINTQAFTLSALDIFYASAVIFLLLTGAVWFARPRSASADTGAAAASGAH